VVLVVRDTPAENANVTQAEIAEIGVVVADNHTLPWGIALRRANLWAMFLVGFCYV
jgi:hypothetical protein